MGLIDSCLKNLGLEGAILSVGLKNKQAFKFYARNGWAISDIDATSTSTVMLKEHIKI
ncbi:MAG: hypothetical protein KTR20_10415 [Cellvibrionaceae bacterium]|nr:hypothetical protein [Cellvibrionaceae bacterium]